LRLTQLRYLDRERVEPLVAVQQFEPERDGDAWWAGEARALGVPIISLGCRTESPREARAYGALAKALLEHRPDVLQTSMFPSNTVGRLVALAAPRLRVIAEEHNCYVWKRRSHIAVDRALARRSDAILACSRAVADYTAAQEGIARGAFRVLYNCLDPGRLRVDRARDDVRAEIGTPPDALVFVAAGRISPQKGFERLVSAMHQMAAPAGRPVELWVAGGDGRDRDRARLEAHVAALGPGAARVRLLGERKDIANVFAAADVFAHAARWEGFGIVLIEAMYASLPVVAFGVNGVPEVVDHGVTGLLVSPDDVGALRGALEAMAADPGRARRMGEAGRERALRLFMPETHVAQLHALYDELLAGRAA
ncbi:MAG TPA: glycosyltransferase family 4 protein, partial [Polyangiaceae bacterium]|nr:glycosyltransferase family 4 protein [Polyangiaceae bacterium]